MRTESSGGCMVVSGSALRCFAFVAGSLGASGGSAALRFFAAGFFGGGAGAGAGSAALGARPRFFGGAAGFFGGSAAAAGFRPFFGAGAGAGASSSSASGAAGASSGVVVFARSDFRSPAPPSSFASPSNSTKSQPRARRSRIVATRPSFAQMRFSRAPSVEVMASSWPTTWSSVFATTSGTPLAGGAGGGFGGAAAAIGALEGAGALAGAFGAGAGPQPSSWERQTMTVLSAPPEASNSPFVDIPENAHAAAPPAWPSSV
mmetsp:Transcript_19189/g.57218  ORF Transcript_19189/g.57218 Transcript_19189/m.57218 type:complete len:261 (-) Transcript_19189:1169-1951(-)